jgi:hypothetical protein
MLAYLGRGAEVKSLRGGTVPTPPYQTRSRRAILTNAAFCQFRDRLGMSRNQGMIGSRENF